MECERLNNGPPKMSKSSYSVLVNMLPYIVKGTFRCD